IFPKNIDFLRLRRPTRPPACGCGPDFELGRTILSGSAPFVAFLSTNILPESSYRSTHALSVIFRSTDTLSVIRPTDKIVHPTRFGSEHRYVPCSSAAWSSKKALRSRFPLFPVVSQVSNWCAFELFG